MKRLRIELSREGLDRLGIDRRAGAGRAVDLSRLQVLEIERARRQSVAHRRHSCVTTAAPRAPAFGFGVVNQTPPATAATLTRPNTTSASAERDEQAACCRPSLHREPAAAGRDDDAQHRDHHRPADPPGALRGEVERETAAEEAVERADDLQVVRADLDHARIVAEQRQPRLRKERRRKPDRFGEAAGDRGAGPGDPQRAVAAAGADAGADHGGERRAEAEHQRHQQIFEPRAGAVAGDGGGAEDAGKAGRGRDADVGRDADQRRRPRRRAGCRASAPRRAAAARSDGLQHAAAGPDIAREDRAADRRSTATTATAPPAMPSCGNGPRPKISTGDSGISTTAPTRDHRRRQEHVAGAADDRGERVEQPERDRAGEHESSNRSTAAASEPSRPPISA